MLATLTGDASAPPPTVTLGNALRDCYEPLEPGRLYVSLWMQNAVLDMGRVQGNAYIPTTLRVNGEPREVYMDRVTFLWLAGRHVKPTADYCLTTETGAKPRVFYRLRITELAVGTGPPVEAPPGYTPTITTDFGSFLRSALATGLTSSLAPLPPPSPLAS